MFCDCSLCFHRIDCDECTFTAHGDVLDIDPDRTVFGFIDNNGEPIVTFVLNNA